MGPFGYDHHAVWWMFIEPDGRPIPHLAEISDTDEPPTDDDREPFAHFLAHLVDDLEMPGVRLAFLVTRPGPDVLLADDRAWAEALYDVTRRAAVGCETVHLGTDAGVLPIPVDELDLTRLRATG